MTDTATPSLSKVEGYKEASHGLAGTIAETYNDPNATHFEEADLQLIKFHGSYQQDDRDQRTERRKQGLDKAWMFMARAKIPGGRMTAAQYLAMDEIAGTCANGTIRVTSRQGIQFHGVLKENFKKLIQAVNACRLTTMGGCGDINRNCMSCGTSDLDWRAGLGIELLCKQLAEHFTPRSTAYWEIWCDGLKWGEPVTVSRDEPIYGKTYLPRKFKMAVAAPEDNCIDLYTQDLGFEAVHEGGRLLAWDVMVGGGMGFAHGNDNTFPRLASRLVRIKPEEALEVAETIVKIQRDHGGRADRKHARLKYLVEDNGVDWFRDELNRRLGRELPHAGPMPEYKVHDHLGWAEIPTGNLAVGIHILNGRIGDGQFGPQRTGLREIVKRFSPDVRLTAKQDVILVGLKHSDKAEIEKIMADHGLRTDHGLPLVRRMSMACVSLPTCGLALAESERYMPTLLDQLEALGVGDAPVEIRMTGCPNGCVRSAMAEIGIIGRGPSRYAIYLGGNQGGTKLAWLWNEKIEDPQLPGTIAKLINGWRAQTNQQTPFGDWANAQGGDALTQLVAAETN